MRRKTYVLGLVVLAGLLALLVFPSTAQWMPATNVTSVNSPQSERGASPSPDGLTLYFASARPGGTGAFDIYRATRTQPYGTFGAPTEVTELNSTASDLMPELRADGLEIFLDRWGNGPPDIWRATRPNITSTFSPPTRVTELNSSLSDHGASLTADGLDLYFTSERTRAGSKDIWMASRRSVNLPFRPPVPVLELNKAGVDDRDPKISPDGLTIFWTSSRKPGAGGNDLWMASRLHRVLPFGNIVNLGAVNTVSPEDEPACWALRDELFFSSNRAGGLGDYDIWSTRFIGLTSAGAAGPGKTQILSFSDPTSVGRVYLAAASLRSTPGIPIGTRTIPLNPDGLFVLSVGGLPPILNGYSRVIDADGAGQGTITFPNNPATIGFVFFNAFVVFDSAAPQGIKTISNAHQVLTQQ